MDVEEGGGGVSVDCQRGLSAWTVSVAGRSGTTMTKGKEEEGDRREEEEKGGSRTTRTKKAHHLGSELTILAKQLCENTGYKSILEQQLKSE